MSSKLGSMFALHAAQAENSRLRAELAEMTESREHWHRKWWAVDAELAALRAAGGQEAMRQKLHDIADAIDGGYAVRGGEIRAALAAAPVGGQAEPSDAQPDVYDLVTHSPEAAQAMRAAAVSGEQASPYASKEMLAKRALDRLEREQEQA